MPETFLLHIKPFKNKVYKTEDSDPGNWSLPGRPFQAQDYLTHARPWQEEFARKARRLYYRRHASAPYAPRQGPGSDKLQSPTSSRARQGQDPGKVLAGESYAVCPRSSSSNHASPWGHSRDAWRMAVQPGGHGGTPGGKAIAVANGDARAGAFGVDGDGH